MTHKPYPTPPRLTLDDFDPESATTDALVALVRQHRQGEEYPTPETLLGHLPIVLRALCDHLLSGEATALFHFHIDDKIITLQQRRSGDGTTSERW